MSRIITIGMTYLAFKSKKIGKYSGAVSRKSELSMSKILNISEIINS
jgi:hypothetical protein